jgi:hypothetical protein
LPSVSTPKVTILSRRVLQNASYAGCHIGNPTIKIVEGEPGWQEAYNNWLRGKNPTSADDWKLGVFLHFEPIDEPEIAVTPSVIDKLPGIELARKVGNIVIATLLLVVLSLATVLYWVVIKLG